MDWKKLSDVHRAMAPEAFARTFADAAVPADAVPADAVPADKTETKPEIRA
jgi:hypothetical protein